MTRLYENWTEAAVDCYNRGCVCKGCIYEILMHGQCRMKAGVTELIRKFGVPVEKMLLPGITKSQNFVVQAILDGAETKREIAEKMNCTEVTVQGRLQNIYQVAETMGCKWSDTTKKLPDLVDWLYKYIRE